MHLILNHDEVASTLAKKILGQHLKHILPSWTTSDAYLAKMTKKYKKTGLPQINFELLNDLIKQDVKHYRDKVRNQYRKKYRRLISWLSDNHKKITLPDSYIIQMYLEDSSMGFVKALAPYLTDDPVWQLAGGQVPDDESMLIRGTAEIHHWLLLHRIAHCLPFWFVDSGYTNFLTENKTWHRLVANHIHQIPKNTYFPPDRLSTLPCLPRTWRTEGKAILVVESSERHYRLFGTTLQAWRDMIKSQLSTVTKRPIIFRSKSDDKKNRDSLYQHLLDSDYYCVISDASAAAIEAVWAGVPIITLNRHFSVPVARTKLQDIDNLYRGPIGDWLCALTYSQFTRQEMFDGTAWQIIEKYHV